MTKREIMKSLEPYSDSQEIAVLNFDSRHPRGVFLAIQRIVDGAPWLATASSMDPVGLCCHAENKLIVRMPNE